jgi:uncharacterized protein YjbI with pentapeptide repeats
VAPPDGTEALETTRLTALDLSASAVRLLAHHGLNDSDTRIASLAAVRNLRGAGRSTLDPRERDELELHLRYWVAMRRVITGEREDDELLPWGEQGRRVTSPDVVLEQARSPAGINSVVIDGVQLDGTGRGDVDRLLLKNCRLLGTTLSGFRLDELTLESTRLLDVSRITSIAAARVTFDDLYTASVSIDVTVEQELTITRSRFGGGSLVADAPSVDCVVRDCKFDLDAGAAARLSITAASLSMSAGGELAGLHLDGCRFERTTFADVVLRGMQATATHLGKADFSTADTRDADLSGCTATSITGLADSAQPPRLVS